MNRSQSEAQTLGEQNFLDGANANFGDGHAEWVKDVQTYQKLLDSYMTSGTEFGPGP